MMMRLALLSVLSLSALLACNSPSAQQSGIDDYVTAKRYFWGEVYAHGGETLYCGKPFVSGRDRLVNVEHVLPMSWVMNKLHCSDRDSCRQKSEFRRIEADMHNLYPALKDVNKARGSFPFGLIRGEQHEFAQCDFELDRKARVVEPRPQVRGDIARAMFYMHDRYQIRLHRRLGLLLKQWHRQDPPDQAEKSRNDRIARIQGNRNHFIDRPDEADRLRF